MLLGPRPCHKRSVPPSASRCGRQWNTPFVRRSFMTRRMLLVDDELAILLTLKAISEMNGFKAFTAASFAEAKLRRGPKPDDPHFAARRNWSRRRPDR